MAYKKTSITLDFDLWLKALPELKRRGLGMSEFFHIALTEFIRRVEKQKEEGKSNDKESDSSPKQ